MIQSTTLTVEYQGRIYTFPLNKQSLAFPTLSGDPEQYFFIPGYEGSPLYLEVEENHLYLFSLEGEDKILVHDLSEKSTFEHEKLTFHLWSEYDDFVSIYLGTGDTVYFGSHTANNIILKRADASQAFMIIQIDNSWVLRSLEDDVYINGTICTGLLGLNSGDEIFYNSYRIIFHEDYITLFHHYAYTLNGVVIYSEFEKKNKRDYPNFKRTPRRSYLLPEEEIVIPKIPVPPKKDTTGLLGKLIPSFASVAGTILMGLLMGRGVIMMVMAGVSVITIIITAVRFIKEKKEQKIEEEEKSEFYLRNLDTIRIQIRKDMQRQRQVLLQNYPSPAEMCEKAKTFSPELWERSPDQQDFMHVRIGTGDIPLSFSVSYNYSTDDKEIEKSPLHKDALELSNKYSQVRDVPVEITLHEGIVGVIGKRETIVWQTMSLLLQLISTHSYRDVSLVVIYPQDEERYWGSLKWTPHTWVGDKQFKAMVKDTRTRDNILGSLYQFFKERKQKLQEEKSSKAVYFPPTIFIIANLDLVVDHGIMEFLSEDSRSLGIYSIYVTENKDLLPSETKTILEVLDEKHTQIIREKGLDKKQSYNPDFCTPDILNETCRAVAPINHVASTESAMPDYITFLQMYGVEAPDELAVLQRWGTNKAYKTLAVPIGYRGSDELLELNIHEKAHGPHGLVAGTTGSGKSETIQTYILSIAVNFHPYSVAFLLIDYKGGGMAGLFDKLPHLVGMITNLDGAQTMRALVAIKSELRRRQEVFSEYNVNHIDQYQKLFEEGVAKDPMPHLLIISDEFAELKSEKPEFIRELVSAARIGRSLGIHLILATQKPSGVVDDQIWSNSKFRLCLKVQNASDSNEMLKTPDAASITKTGRGYLQVGNNEIYELFQSAYSGAEYFETALDKQNDSDQNVYLFNELGQTQLLTQDLSKNMVEKKESEKVTELSMLVSYVNSLFEKEHLKPLNKPWLPPLEDRIFIQDIPSFPKEGLRAVMGTLDQPQFQKQSPYILNLTTDGHVVVFGSSGMGKSNFLRTLAVNLASEYTPEEVQFYIMDFGNNALIPLRDLPHTADAITLEDNDKMGKLFRIIRQKMKYRKTLLGEKGLPSIESYNKVNNRIEPYIVLLLDNIDPVKEQQMEEIEKFIQEVTREGQSLGIIIAFSASRPGAVRYTLLSNIKNQCALYLIDKNETYNIVGRSELESESIPGRGLIKSEGEVFTLQIALPSAGQDDEEVVKHFREWIQEKSNAWSGPRPAPIPILPEILLAKEFYENEITLTTLNDLESSLLPIALDSENVETYSIDLGKISHYLLVGGSGSGKSNALHMLLMSARKKWLDSSFYIFDNDMMKLADWQGKEETKFYTNQKEQYAQVLETIEEEINQRRNAFLKQVQEGGKMIPPAVFYKQFPHFLIVINNLSQSLDRLGAAGQTKAAELFENARQTGIHFIIASNAADFGKSFDAFSKAIKATETGLLQVGADKQQVWNLGYQVNKAAPFAPGEAFDVQSGQVIRIKLPLVVES